MSGSPSNTAASVQPRSKADLIFHPLFRDFKPGDVILLQADDRRQTCFYFRLSILKAVSSFFDSLPPPSSADLIEGTPLIPLCDAPSASLAILLEAIRSLVTGDPFQINPKGHLNATEVLQAAVLAKCYQIPGVYRLLSEGISGHAERGEYDLVHFGIWAIGERQAKIAQAMEATRDCDLTIATKDTSRLLKSHAPLHWMHLLDFHLRYDYALDRFRTFLDDDRSFEPCHVVDCDANCEEESGIETEVLQELREAESVEQILKLRAGHYGLDCKKCRAAARRHFKPVMKWLENYVSTYPSEDIPLNMVEKAAATV